MNIYKYILILQRNMYSFCDFLKKILLLIEKALVEAKDMPICTIHI